jgi:hypothetical protein
MSQLHHNAASARRARSAITQWANRHVDTRCWRCGRTRLEHGRPWHAGHTIDGDPNAQPWFSNADPPAGSWLRAECEQCNTSEGARRGNALRLRPGTTRDW